VRAFGIAGIPEPSPDRAARDLSSPARVEESVLILAMHPHPSFADQSHEAVASKKIRGGRAPEGANELAASPDAARADRSALAFRRPTAALAPAICRSSIRAALHAMYCAGVTRAVASRLSEAPRAPVVMPTGSMPGPPESGSDEPPPAGTAPAPSVGVTG
jgi:hypothetical protein